MEARSIHRAEQLAAIPPAVVSMCAQLRKAGHRAWIVGGSLRDLLMSRAVADWDIATSARPDEVQRVFNRVVPTGIQHGTVTVLWKGRSYEVTTLRGEGDYSDGRRPDHVFFVDHIEEDLARRDFTINALAYDPDSRALIDPFGGLADLEANIIRAVGDPSARFGEDGLRILRAARFSAVLEFDLDKATEAAMAGALGTFRRVSKERVRDEWLKALGARRPSRAFEIMRHAGILAITFPELLEQVGCEQNRWHAFDVWTHTMRCVDEHEGGPIERLAALLHDVGKPSSRSVSEKTGDFTFYDHEKVGARMAGRWLREYKFSNDDRETVVHLVRHHLVCYSGDWTDAAVRRFVRRVGSECVRPLLRLARADVLAKGRPVFDELSALAELERRIDGLLAASPPMSVRDLAISGSEVVERLQTRPGPMIGRILRALLERVTEDPALNTPDKLLPLVDELGAKEGMTP